MARRALAQGRRVQGARRHRDLFMSCPRTATSRRLQHSSRWLSQPPCPTHHGRLSTGRRNSREDAPHLAHGRQSARGGAAAGGQRALASGGPPEVPILLLKLRLPATGKEDDMPSEISMFSVFASEQEWVFPPGTFLEQKKEHTEVIVGCGIEGDQCRVVEIAPYIAAVRRQAAEVKAQKKGGAA